MGNLVRKVLLFVGLILGICSIVDLFIPYYWGNPWYASKMSYLEENEIRPTVSFFGSSRVYRQIDPSLFDQLASNHKIGNVNSYNLGAPATFCPQNYLLFEKFLESDLCIEGSTVFVELMEIDRISTSLFHQERTNYWINIHYFRFVVQSVWENPKLSYREKLTTFYEYLISFIERYFHIGHFGQAIMDHDYYSRSYLGEKKDGYYSLQNNILKTKRREVREDLILRQSNLNLASLKERAEQSVLDHNETNKEISLVHYNEILRLISKAQSKEVDLNFMLLPRNSSLALVNLINKLPEGNCIDLSNSSLFPEFYSMENSFDFGHLNDFGAKKLTEQLFIEWNHN